MIDDGFGIVRIAQQIVRVGAIFLSASLTQPPLDEIFAIVGSASWIASMFIPCGIIDSPPHCTRASRNQIAIRLDDLDKQDELTARNGIFRAPASASISIPSMSIFSRSSLCKSSESMAGWTRLSPMGDP